MLFLVLIALSCWSENVLTTSPPSLDDAVISLQLCDTSFYVQDDEQLRVFNNQIAEDKKIIVSRHNLVELHKVLEELFEL